MIQTTSPEAVREFVGRLRPIYRARLRDQFAIIILLGASVFFLSSIAMKMTQRTPLRPGDIFIAFVCVATALVTASLCSVFVSGSLRHEDGRLTFRAFPGFFDWSFGVDAIEALRIIPLGRGYVLEVRERGATKFRLVTCGGIQLSEDIKRFLKEAAEPGATDNPDDAQRLREDH